VPPRQAPRTEMPALTTTPTQEPAEVLVPAIEPFETISHPKNEPFAVSQLNREMLAPSTQGLRSSCIKWTADCYSDAVLTIRGNTPVPEFMHRPSMG
jgi:hypothetical protein